MSWIQCLIFTLIWHWRHLAAWHGREQNVVWVSSGSFQCLSQLGCLLRVPLPPHKQCHEVHWFRPVSCISTACSSEDLLRSQVHITTSQWHHCQTSTLLSSQNSVQSNTLEGKMRLPLSFLNSFPLWTSWVWDWVCKSGGSGLQSRHASELCNRLSIRYNTCSH